MLVLTLLLLMPTTRLPRLRRLQLQHRSQHQLLLSLQL
jgi:hypothetical protein